MTSRPLFVCCALASLACAALASWPSDPASNLAVSTRSGQQAQPKVVVVPGSADAWVSWFDNADGGFDVYVQRLDADAGASFPANGLLVADRAFSSTQDYDLDVSPAGDAYLVFRDMVGGVTHVVAHRVNADGTMPWGPGGVQLSSGNSFVAAPKCAVATDGHVYFAWKSDANVILQRLDASGVATLGAGVVVAPAMGDNTASDLVASTGGDVILSMVNQPSGFAGPKHIVAQKFDAAGARQWGASEVAVFDGGSLQFGNFPSFVADGAGGAVFAWYSTALQCFTQRLNADGTERYAHNGVPVTTVGGSNLRVSPDVAFSPSTGETFVFWSELNSSQSMSGVRGQKFDDAGVAQWTNAGAGVVPLSGASRTFVNVESLGTDAVVTYLDRATPVSGSFVRSARLDSIGAQVWAGSPVTASTDSGGKGRLTTAVDPLGRVFAAWSDERTDSGDIYAQAINDDGTLGGGVSVPCPGDCDGSGTVDFNDLVSMLFEFGPVGAAVACDADDSGTVDFNDLVTALFLFGPCP